MIIQLHFYRSGRVVGTFSWPSELSLREVEPFVHELGARLRNWDAMSVTST